MTPQETGSRICKSGTRGTCFPEASLSQHRARLLALDPFWLLDYGFIEHLAGSSGAKELQKLWMLEVMPAEGRHVQLDEAVRRGQAFLKKPLYLFTGSVAQGTIRAAS